MESSLGDWRQDIRVLPAKWQLRGALDVGKELLLQQLLVLESDVIYHLKLILIYKQTGSFSFLML